MRLRGALLTILLVLAFGLVGPAGAQAAEWEVKEAPLSSLELSKETVSSSGGAFELTVPTISLTVKCTSENGSGEILKGGSTSKVSFELGGCVVSKAEKLCSVKSPSKSTGVLSATATTKFFDKEVAKVTRAYEELVPTMTVEITGVECPFPTKLLISGATAGEVPRLEEEFVERPQVFSKAAAEQSGVTSLKLGKNQAFLIGEDKEALSGAHKKDPLGFTDVILGPPQLFIPEPAFSEAMFLENIGPERVKFTNILLENGAFEVTDAAPCKNEVFAADVSCPISIECLAGPSVGTLLVEWDVLNNALAVIGFGRRRATLSCAVA